MRVASRVIGTFLALAGVAFFVVCFFMVSGRFDRRSVLVESGPNAIVWAAAGFSAILGVGFILAGRYYLTLDIDSLDKTQEQPPSRSAAYFLARRRSWKVIAQIGLLISLIRLGAACFGIEWSGRWVTWPLLIVLIGLAAIESRIAGSRYADHIDWETVPQPLQQVLRLTFNAGVTLFFVLMLLFLWNGWARHKVAPQIVLAGAFVLPFAWEAMFFSYGVYREKRS